eukprot:2586400-Rhodomonas_salina.2
MSWVTPAGMEGSPFACVLLRVKYLQHNILLRTDSERRTARRPRPKLSPRLVLEAKPHRTISVLAYPALPLFTFHTHNNAPDYLDWQTDLEAR